MGIVNKYLSFAVVATCLCLHMTRVPHALAQDEADVSQPEFAKYALALRSAILASEDDALRLLASVPGTNSLIDLNSPDETSTAILERLWVPFFQNVLLEIAEEEGNRPAALYYNPLSDAGLYTQWVADGDGEYQIAQLNALPGERLGNDSPRVFDLPEWMTAEDSISVLVDVVAKRRKAFGDYDRQQRLPAENETRYREAVGEFLAIAPRLVQDGAWREGWIDIAWLPATLDRIQELLKARDPVELLKTAPETTLDMAELLSELSDAVVENLLLDRVLAVGEASSLLIGSSPEDGTTYIWVSCQITDDTCTINGLAVLSFIQVI